MATTSDHPTRVDHWPDLLFWYPGLSYHDLCRMPNNIREKFEGALPRLRAEAQAAAIDAAAFPHMKADAQKKLIRRIERRTGSDRARMQKTPMTAEEERAMLNRAGIGVEFDGPAPAPAAAEGVGADA